MLPVDAPSGALVQIEMIVVVAIARTHAKNITTLAVKSDQTWRHLLFTTSRRKRGIADPTCLQMADFDCPQSWPTNFWLPVARQPCATL